MPRLRNSIDEENPRQIYFSLAYPHLLYCSPSMGKLLKPTLTVLFLYKMWAFYGNLWAIGDNVIEISYRKGIGTPNGCPISPQTVARIQTHALGYLAAPRAHVLPLYSTKKIIRSHRYDHAYPFPSSSH